MVELEIDEMRSIPELESILRVNEVQEESGEDQSKPKLEEEDQTVSVFGTPLDKSIEQENKEESNEKDNGENDIDKEGQDEVIEEQQENDQEIEPSKANNDEEKVARIEDIRKKLQEAIDV